MAALQTDRLYRPRITIGCAGSMAYLKPYDDGEASWDEKHYLWVPKGGTHSIEITIHDDTYVEDTVLASTSVAVDDLEAGSIEKRSLQLSGNGTLNVAFTNVPLTGDLSGAPVEHSKRCSR
jgi:hypothetical protein